MNLAYLEKVPTCIRQALLISLLKEEEFADALKLLETFPTLATTMFQRIHQHACLDDLLAWLCRQTTFHTEDEDFMKILLFPFKESDGQCSPSDGAERQERLWWMMLLLKNNNRDSDIFTRIATNEQSKLRLRPFLKN